MSETDSPDTGSGNDTALSVEAGAAAIEGLLSDVPDTDSVASEESQTKGQDTHQPGEAEANPTDGDDDLEFDDDVAPEASDAPKSSTDKDMKFAPDEAKVTLADGTAISVAELKAGFMFQRKFTEKTTELAGEKKVFEAERQHFAETKSQIEKQREVIIALAGELMPSEPPRPDDPNDAVAYIEYRIAKDAYDEKMARLQFLWNSKQHGEQQQTQKSQAEQIRERENAIREGTERLQTYLPKFKDKEALQKFHSDALEFGTKVYDLTPEEINSIVDPRFIYALHDAISFRKALAKRDAKAAPAPPAQQPRIPPRQRMSQTPQSRDIDSASERLRKSGSIDDAAKALLKFV